ncbi:MAG: hypothetical protein WB952_18090 [Terriglobales bacterium]
MDWNKVGAVSGLGCFGLAAITFGIQIWPVPQIRAAKGDLAWSIGGPKLIGVLLVAGFLLCGISIYGAWRRRPNRAISKLVIHSAVYGTGPIDEVSVIDRLNAIAKDGLVVLVDNNLVVGQPDPAPNRPKRLVVEYSYGNDVRHTITRGESTLGRPSRLVLPEDSELAKHDTLQQEKLHGRLIHLEDRLNQSLLLSDQFKSEADELYADMVFGWLRDHIRTTGSFSVTTLTQSTGLPQDAVTRGLGLLKSKYQIVSQRLPDVDAWSFVAGSTPFVPKYKIAVATREPAIDPSKHSPRNEARELSDDLHAFLKELGPCPAPKKAAGQDDLEFIRYASSQVGPWTQRLVAGWAGRFADRACKTRHLLAERNVVDFELDQAIDATNKNENNILRIADKFLLLSSRVDN